MTDRRPKCKGFYLKGAEVFNSLPLIEATWRKESFEVIYPY